MGATLIYADAWTDGRTDGRTDTTKLISAFRDNVNVSRDEWLIGRKDGNIGGQYVVRNSLHQVSFADTKSNLS
jgi:hypothetical protein